MMPDNTQPFSRAVFREAMEWLIGRPLSETELEVLCGQFTKRAPTAPDLLLHSMQKRRVEYLGPNRLRYRRKVIVGESTFHAIVKCARM